MMRALYKIGRLSSSGAGDPLQDVVNRVAPETHVIALELKTNSDGSVSLANEDEPFRLLFEASDENQVKIGYKKKSANGPDFTPCAISTFDEKIDTADKKIRTFDNKILGFFRIYEGTSAQILQLKEFFDNEETACGLRELYFNYMVTHYGSIPVNKRRTLLCVVVDGKLPGQRSEYRELLVESSTDILGAGESEGNGKCSLSLFEDMHVYGNPSKIFSFYTIDKPGMITGGFRRESAWKNFPVSAEAGQCLKQARDYLDRNQQYRMPGGFRYWVIPKFVFAETEDDLSRIMEELSNYSASSPGFGLGHEAIERFSEVEDRIKLIQGFAESQVLLSFLFWEKNNAQLKINLLVDDVPPTRLKRLIDAQKRVAKLDTYDHWQSLVQSREKDRTIRFSFGLVWPFFKREAQKGGKLTYSEDYLRFIRALYLNQAPDHRLVLELIMEFLAALFKDPDDQAQAAFLYRPLHAMCWLRYLCELKLWKPAINYKGVSMDFETLSIEPVFKERDTQGLFTNPWMRFIEQFYKEHEAMLSRPFLFGAFLLGSLIRMVMQVQYVKLRSSPFEKELKGLRLKKADIPTLFSKTIAKLRDYEQGDSYRVLDELVSDLCLRDDAGGDQVTDEEVSAYLTFGLAQGRVFKKLVNIENEKKNKTNHGG